MALQPETERWRLKPAGWVERSDTHHPSAHATDGFRGACHRARVRATRWLYPPCATAQHSKAICAHFKKNGTQPKVRWLSVGAVGQERLSREKRHGGPFQPHDPVGTRQQGLGEIPD